jgi:hypothetical protein
MLDKSFFVNSEVQSRKVKLGEQEHELWFKEVPAVEFRRFSLAEQSEDENVRVASIAKLIVASLCNPDGSPALTVEQALKLNAGAVNAIFEQVLFVNGQGDKKKD